MKQSILLLFSLFWIAAIGVSQELVGAWEEDWITEDGKEFKTVLVLTENYHVQTTYALESGDFLTTKGGLWKQEGTVLSQFVEFDSEVPERSGTEIQNSFRIKNDMLFMQNRAYKRIDDGTPGELVGAWWMSSRIVDGELQEKDMKSPRITMKVLSGTRFQWIAFNIAKKEFYATGGGTYTTKNKEYIESIEFFSRDSSRVGMDLKFNYERDNKEKDWHHTGFSSKGDPIDEVWSLRP